MSRLRKNVLIFVAIGIGLTLCGCSAYQKKVDPPLTPAGGEKEAKTKVLETGAQVFQANPPVSSMDIYLVDAHLMKDRPNAQVEAHHFCRQTNEDFVQCAVFDGNTKNANLTGVEYIISEKLFNSLPLDERKYWHPHNYEILSGLMVAPNLRNDVERDLMKTKLNSYGKMWRIWNTGHFGMNDGQTLPLGEPALAWSFNRDGETMPGLAEDMQNKLKIDFGEKRASRKELVQFAKPQIGVDALKNEFLRPTRSIPGVRARALTPTPTSPRTRR